MLLTEYCHQGYTDEDDQPLLFTRGFSLALKQFKGPLLADAQRYDSGPRKLSGRIRHTGLVLVLL